MLNREKEPVNRCSGGLRAGGFIVSERLQSSLFCRPVKRDVGTGRGRDIHSSLFLCALREGLHDLEDVQRESARGVRGPAFSDREGRVGDAVAAGVFGL